MIIRILYCKIVEEIFIVCSWGFGSGKTLWISGYDDEWGSGEIEDTWRTWEESRKSNIIATLSVFSALFEIDLRSVGHEISISDSTNGRRVPRIEWPNAFPCLSYKRFVTMSWISYGRREQPSRLAKAPVLYMFPVHSLNLLSAHLKHVRSPCIHRLSWSN